MPQPHWGEFIYVLLMLLLETYDGLTYSYELNIVCPTVILVIARPCKVVVDVKELFRAERKSQLYELNELLKKKEISLIGRVKWSFCMKTRDNIVQGHMLLTSIKVVIGNHFARDMFYCKLTGRIVTVCN